MTSGDQSVTPCTRRADNGALAAGRDKQPPWSRRRGAVVAPDGHDGASSAIMARIGFAGRPARTVPGSGHAAGAHRLASVLHTW